MVSVSPPPLDLPMIRSLPVISAVAVMPASTIRHHHPSIRTPARKPANCRCGRGCSSGTSGRRLLASCVLVLLALVGIGLQQALLRLGVLVRWRRHHVPLHQLLQVLITNPQVWNRQISPRWVALLRLCAGLRFCEHSLTPSESKRTVYCIRVAPISCSSLFGPRIQSRLLQHI